MPGTGWNQPLGHNSPTLRWCVHQWSFLPERDAESELSPPARLRVGRDLAAVPDDYLARNVEAEAGTGYTFVFRMV